MVKRNRKKIGILAGVSVLAALFIGSAAVAPVQDKWEKEPVGVEVEEKLSLVEKPGVSEPGESLLEEGDVDFDLEIDEADAIAEIELAMPFDDEVAETAVVKPAAADPEEDNSAKALPPPDVPVYLQMQYLPTENGYIHPHEKRVNGLAIGYYLPQQEINGVSLALCHMYNRKKQGFSASLLDVCVDSDGAAFFLVGGAVINRGFSMGLWNMTENNQGVQFGLFNQEEDDILFEYEFKPEPDKESFGVQAGLVNYSDARGVQFGLWNINPNSLIPHFPLFNICL